MSSTNAQDRGQCQWCGAHHDAICPRVKTIEYHQDGSLRRVEFHPHVGIGKFGEAVAPSGSTMAINALLPPHSGSTEKYTTEIVTVVADSRPVSDIEGAVAENIRKGGALVSAISQRFGVENGPSKRPWSPFRQVDRTG